jgi:hypothetical protein
VAHALDNAGAVAVELDDADFADIDATAASAPAPVERGALVKHGRR